MQFDLFQTLERMGLSIKSGAPIIFVITGGDLARGREPAVARRRWTIHEDSAVLVQRFFADLVDGRLGFAAALPARSVDIFECYRSWCHRSELEPLNQPRFARILAQGGRVKVRVWRYIDGDRIAQHAIAFDGGRPVPESGGHEGAAALGAKVATFRTGMKVYRGGA
ncbi:hypothetical protein D3C86_1408740 [compost metagenome]